MFRRAVLRHVQRGRRACSTNSASQSGEKATNASTLNANFKPTEACGKSNKYWQEHMQTWKNEKSYRWWVVGAGIFGYALGSKSSNHYYYLDSYKGNCGHRSWTSDSDFPFCGSRRELKYKDHELQDENRRLRFQLRQLEDIVTTMKYSPYSITPRELYLRQSVNDVQGTSIQGP